MSISVDRYKLVGQFISSKQMKEYNTVLKRTKTELGAEGLTD